MESYQVFTITQSKVIIVKSPFKSHLYPGKLAIFSSLLFVTFLLTISYPTTQSECNPRDFGHGSIVCVCNGSYCDTLPPFSVKSLGKGKFYHVVSTKDGKRFENSTKSFLPGIKQN